MNDLNSTRWALLGLRLGLASVWLSHALLKYLVFTLAGTAAFLESQGLPGWFSGPLFAAELIGGLMMLLGLYARQVSLLLTPIMLGASWVHWPNGWLFTNPGGGWEYPVLLSLLSLVFWALGDGALALKKSTAWLPADQQPPGGEPSRAR